MRLSDHFTLYELTITSNAPLQGKNRELTDDQIAKLKILATHCEAIRALCGNQPMAIHSGYRCQDLNGATLGSSSTSQHPRCEAVDFNIMGQDIEDTFKILYQAGIDGKFKFGQLIIEEAERNIGPVRWVHCSVIGTLDPSKVGQVMKMEAGPDGVPHYEMVGKLDFA